MDDAHSSVEHEIDQVRSAVYAWLAAVLRYPDPGVLSLLADAQRWSFLHDRLLQHDVPLAGLFAVVEDRLRGEREQNNLAQRLQGRFGDLFGHSVRGACPPYEMEYGKSEINQQANELADIRGFYAAFGLELVQDANERIDHACCECEFMSVLAARLSQAIAQDNREARQVFRDAQGSFLCDHLGRWFPAFARRLQTADADAFYGRVGEFALRFIRWECECFDAPCGPEYLQLREVDPEKDAAIECGVEDSCPGAAPTHGQAAAKIVQLGIEG